MECEPGFIAWHQWLERQLQPYPANVKPQELLISEATALLDIIVFATIWRIDSPHGRFRRKQQPTSPASWWSQDCTKALTVLRASRTNPSARASAQCRQRDGGVRRGATVHSGGVKGNLRKPFMQLDHEVLHNLRVVCRGFDDVVGLVNNKFFQEGEELVAQGPQFGHKLDFVPASFRHAIAPAPPPCKWVHPLVVGRGFAAGRIEPHGTRPPCMCAWHVAGGKAQELT